MNIHDDLSNEPDAQPEPRDPIADRLHREAMAERQPVSPALHRRILQHVYGEPLASQPRWNDRLWLWLPKAAAAALAAAVVWTGWSTLRSHRPSTPNVGPPMVENVLLSAPSVQQPPIAAAQRPVALSINVDGILLARVWPPQICICLPIAEILPSPQPLQTRSAPSISPPCSPQWLLAKLQEPTSSAQAAIVDLIPPNLLELAELVRFDH